MDQKGSIPLVLIIGVIGLAVFLLVAAMGSFKDTVFNTFYPKPYSQAAETPIRGIAGDLWADIVLGQPNFSQTVPDEKTNFKAANPGAAVVDTSVTPQRVYIYDGINSRVLGYSSLGACQNNTTQACTSDSDCGGSTCQIQVGGDAGSKRADLVLGQLDFTTAACNGDGTGQLAPPRIAASAASMCTQRDSEHSLYEGGASGQMDVDSTGNLYLNDHYNNRVIKYNSPFTTDRVADLVIGQTDFAGNTCNQGKTLPDATTVCFDNQWNTSGMDVDKNGNIWVADNGNHRVLRFPNVSGTVSKTADMVLGQTNFSSRTSLKLCTDNWNAATCTNQNTGLNGFNNPVAVKVADDGKVYVADTWNHRVVVFDTPATGATGRLFATGFKMPSGLTLDPINNGIWINNSWDGTNRLVLYSFDGVRKKIIGPINGIPSIQENRSNVGITKDGDVIVGSWEGLQDTWYYKHPIQDSINNVHAKFFYPPGRHNYLSNKGFNSPRGIVLRNGQLIVADTGRVAFWNIPNGITDLSNFKPYDGVVGVANFTQNSPDFFRISADNNNNLWVIRNNTLQHYVLPLTHGEMPDRTINMRDLKLLGSAAATGLDFNPGGIYADKQGRYLWLSAPYKNRVMRVRLPSNLQTGDYLIDVMIGGNTIPTTTTGFNDKAICTTQSPNLICYPGAVVEDTNQHLYLADNFLESHGTNRLLRFDKTKFPINNPSLLVYFTDSAAQSFSNVAAWEPTFDATNRMLAGLSFYNGIDYNGPNSHRYPMFVNNILSQTGPVLTPNGGVKDIYSQPFNSAFDQAGNLFIADLNWGRVLVYKTPFGAVSGTPTPSSTPTPAITPTPTVAPTPTNTPTLPPTPTPTPTPGTGNFTNLSASLTDTTAQFNFSHSGSATPGYRIHLSNTANFTNIYQTFGYGISSPVIVQNPSTRWTEYQCGRTMYWKVATDNNQLQSPMQTAVVNCGTPTPSPTIAPMTGDANNDRKVDIFDYNIIVGQFNQTGTNLSGDLNKSGKVDIFDYNLVVANFGRTS